MRLDELEANVGGAELLRSDLVIIRVETIKQLIALCRLQHEALTRLDMTGIKYNESPVDAVGRMRGIAQEALAASPFTEEAKRYWSEKK
jgi:hypothetical protein